MLLLRISFLVVIGETYRILIKKRNPQFFMSLFQFWHFINKVGTMGKENDRVGEMLPSTTLYDLDGKRIDVNKWKGRWTLLVFLRHLG